MSKATCITTSVPRVGMFWKKPVQPFAYPFTVDAMQGVGMATHAPLRLVGSWLVGHADRVSPQTALGAAKRDRSEARQMAHCNTKSL